MGDIQSNDVYLCVELYNIENIHLANHQQLLRVHRFHLNSRIWSYFVNLEYEDNNNWADYDDDYNYADFNSEEDVDPLLGLKKKLKMDKPVYRGKPVGSHRFSNGMGSG